MKFYLRNFFQFSIDNKRIYGLDILRALAILFVVIGHGGVYLPERTQILSDFITFDGVSIFFVLSGFLIGSILIKLLDKNQATIKTLFNFWIRRWMRTLPNYYLLLFLLLMVLPFLFYGGMSNPLKNIKYLLFLQNLNSPHPHFFEESWSLCVEEWFYLIVPIVIFFLVGFIKISVKNVVLIVAFGLILASMIFRYIKYTSIPINTFGDWDMNIRKQVFTRLDSNMFGMVGAYISYYYRDAWIKYKLPLLIIGIVILLVQRYIDFGDGYGIYMCVFSFSLVSLGVLFLLPFFSGYKNGSGFIYKFFTFISIISYSMYLLNYSLFSEYGRHLLDYFSLTGYNLILVQYIWYWLFVILGSFILYKFYEKPMMDLREKFK
jgi:peptidoglycan/LPS O-acetylase OafA/YrhL